MCIHIYFKKIYVFEQLQIFPPLTWAIAVINLKSTLEDPRGRIEFNP